VISDCTRGMTWGEIDRRWEHICDRCEAEVHIARLRVGVGEGGGGHNRGKGILCIIYFP
jgi:hypothetical protein